MNPREAIDRARDILAGDNALKGYLRRNGVVEIPVMQIDWKIDLIHDAPTNEPEPVVTFRKVNTPFGKSVMAEFNGYTEFLN